MQRLETRIIRAENVRVPSKPELRRCSPRSQPNTLSFKIPRCFSFCFVGRDFMNVRKNVMSLPCFLDTKKQGKGKTSQLWQEVTFLLSMKRNGGLDRLTAKSFIKSTLYILQKFSAEVQETVIYKEHPNFALSSHQSVILLDGTVSNSKSCNP